MITGIVDIGTNSIRLLAAQFDGETINVIKTALKTTRIGEGMGQSRTLSREAMTRTLRGLAEYKEILKACQVEEIKIVATSAVRDAENKREFLNMVKEEIDWDICVLPGEQEAYLSYLGAVKGLGGSPANTIVVDVGGGSTEFVWPEAKGIKCASLKLGAVRMTEQKATIEDIKGVLGELPAMASGFPILEPVGVGGTFTTLAAVDQGLRVYEPAKVHGYKIHKKSMETILRDLEMMSLGERKQVAGLQPERADIILAGIRIALSVAEKLEVSEITVSETDIMYGLIYDQSK